MVKVAMGHDCSMQDGVSAGSLERNPLERDESVVDHLVRLAEEKAAAFKIPATVG